MHPWLKALATFVLPAHLAYRLREFLFARCRCRLPAARHVALERKAPGFKQAENDRVAVTEPGLQAVNLDGNHYVRWSFAISPKQATTLSTIRIEDVSDLGPFSPG